MPRQDDFSQDTGILPQPNTPSGLQHEEDESGDE